MRRTVCLLACVLHVGVAMGSDSPKEYDGEPMQEDGLGGAWQVVSLEGEGFKVLPLGVVVFTFQAGKLTISYEDGTSVSITYTADPSRKPAHYGEMVPQGGGKWKWSRSIYQVEGDTLRIGSTVGGNRPASFQEKGIAVLTYRRVK